jgi:hypothetical protein
MRANADISRAIIVPAAAMLQGGCGDQSRASIICRPCGGYLGRGHPMMARAAIDDSVIGESRTQSELRIAINREIFFQCRCTP